MGLLFTIVYIITAYLAPETVFGGLAQYHVEIVIVVLALIFSIFSTDGSNVMKLPQSWAIVGLCSAVAMSLIGNGWIGGAPPALMAFVPEVVTFFLIVINCRKKWHLQLLALTLFFCAAYTIYAAEHDIAILNYLTHYVLSMRVADDSPDRILRIKGMSFLGDPNDFAQFMVSLIPIMFLFWAKGSPFRNFLLVYVPCAVLFWGMYLTHSRGSMVALMALCIVAFRRKIGVVPSIIGGMVFFAVLTATGFSGGRDVSAGDDRIAAWATGLLLIRSHPIFGVGFQRFSDFNDITAHNTFVVCAAELGLLGVFFWVLLMFVTVRNSWETAKLPEEVALDRQKKLEAAEAKQPLLQAMPILTESSMTPATVSGAAPVTSQSHQFAGAGAPFVLPADIASEYAGNNGVNHLGNWTEEDDKEAKDAEIRRMSGLMVACFVGFLTAGWFLSRAYTMCLYVNAGIAAAIFRMAQDRGIAPQQLTFGQASKITWKIVVALIAIVWLIVHFDHYMPK
jgi:O-antigen ligase